MKFTRRSRTSPRPITNRRLKLAEKALQRERDKFPLLADWVAEQQPTPLGRLEHFQDAAVVREKMWRQHTADTWRRARRWLFILSECDRRKLIAEWNNSFCPKTSEYFADFISHRIPAANEEGKQSLQQMIDERRKQALKQ